MIKFTCLDCGLVFSRATSLLNSDVKKTLKSYCVKCAFKKNKEIEINGIKIDRYDYESKFLLQIDQTPGLGPNGDCWEWTGVINSSNGYGYMKISEINSPVRIHRFSYEFFKGKITPGLFVMHSCDNRKCVNPDHLSLGTHQDNMDDAVNKGRMQQGEDRYCAKLTEEEVLQIYKDYKNGKMDQYRLAEKYNVKQTTIQQITSGHTWKHITGGKPLESSSKHCSKLEAEDVLKIREEYKTGDISIYDLALKYDVKRDTIFKVVNGKTWKKVTNGEVVIPLKQPPTKIGKSFGEMRYNAKMTDEKVREARKLYESGWSIRKLMEKYEMSECPITQIVKRQSWKHVI